MSKAQRTKCSPFVTVFALVNFEIHPHYTVNHPSANQASSVKYVMNAPHRFQWHCNSLSS
jgi:uncharacterized protein YcnI